MTIIFEERPSDSPYVESITHGWTLQDGSPTRPAEIHWHMVLMKAQDQHKSIIAGPWSSSGIVSYQAGAEVIWIKFKLGTFMPHLPTRKLLDKETTLPEARSNAFWLNGSSWQFPNIENVDTFIDWMAHEDILVCDPVIHATLQHQLQPETIASRTVRHRFLRATGLTQSHIRQYERAQKAAALLKQGVSILDTTFEAGYFDQPHLTRSLKQFTGFTPAQLLQLSQPHCIPE